MYHKPWYLDGIPLFRSFHDVNLSWSTVERLVIAITVSGA